jgi:hypothetical protein
MNKILNIFKNKKIIFLIYVFLIMLVLSGMQLVVSGVLQENMTNSNNCPKGCKKPNEIYGNCKSVIRDGKEEYACPWDCPNELDECEYDMNCEGCKPWVVFSKEDKSNNKLKSSINSSSTVEESTKTLTNNIKKNDSGDNTNTVKRTTDKHTTKNKSDDDNDDIISEYTTPVGYSDVFMP